MIKNFGYMLSSLKEVPRFFSEDTWNIKELGKFFKSQGGGECSFYDRISYHSSLVKFTGKQIVNILQYAHELVCNTPTTNELSSIFTNEQIDINIRRVIFFNVYREYAYELCQRYASHLGKKYISENF